MFKFLKNLVSEPVISASSEPHAADENETAYQYAESHKNNGLYGFNDMANGAGLDQFNGSTTAHLQYNPDDDY